MQNYQATHMVTSTSDVDDSGDAYLGGKDDENPDISF